MKYAEIFIIRAALQELGKEKLPIAFEIAKNVRACNKIIDETQSLAKELFEEYADREEDGSIKIYKEAGKDGKVLEGGRITDPEKFKLYAEAAKKLEQDEHEITLTKIKRSKLEVPAIDFELLMPLLDTVIVDD